MNFLKLIIFCFTMLLLSSICNGQGVTPFGASAANNFSKTLGKLWVTTLSGGGDTSVVWCNDSGVFYRIPIATFRTLVGSSYNAGWALALSGNTFRVDSNVLDDVFLKVYDPSRNATLGSLHVLGNITVNSELLTVSNAEFQGAVTMTGLDDPEEGNIVTIDGSGTLGVSAVSTGDIATNDTLDYIFLPKFFGDTLRVGGDSYAACAGVSPADSCFVNLLSVQLGIPFVNYAVGGTGIRDAALKTYLYKPRDRGLNIINTGPNDTYYATLNNYTLTDLYNYTGNYTNLYLTGCFEDTVSSCQSAYFTKSGSITTNSNASSRSVSLGSTVTVMGAAGNYIEFTTADSGFTVHWFKSTRTRYGSIVITVAGSRIDTLVPQLGAWAVDLFSTDSIFPTAQYYSLKGYGAGSKTVRMTACGGTGASEWWIDAVGFPKTDANKRGVVMMESGGTPLQANNYKNENRLNAVNAARRNFVSQFWEGFPIRIVKQPLNLQSDMQNDGIHPNNKGNRVYDSAFLSAINTCIDNNVYFGNYNPDIILTQVAGDVSVYRKNNAPAINIPYSTFTTPGILKFGLKEIPGGVTQFGDNIVITTLTSPGGILYTNGLGAVTQTAGFNYIAASGSLGIGDATPDEVLDIEKNHTAQTAIRLTNTNGAAGATTGIEFITTSSNAAGLYKRSAAAASVGTAIMGNDLMLYNFANAVASNIIIYGDNSRGKFSITPSGGTTPAFFIDSTRRVKIGNDVNPTAVLHLIAGTSAASTAPLKFTSGTNLATPEAGAVEFDGTNYFVTSSTTRYTLAKTLTNTGTLDFGNTGAQTSADLTITVTGAAVGDVVTLGIPAADANSSYTAYVSSSNTVTVRFNNYSSGSIDPASGTFRVSVLKY